MKKITIFLAFFIFTGIKIKAQIFLPVSTTGYNLDAIAEYTPMVSTTAGGVDAGGNRLHSATYASLYGNFSSGLPDNGLISSGTRTYQLESYTGANVLYISGINTASLTLATPASYCALSMLAFATDGVQSVNVTVLFTDNSTHQYNNIALSDWYNGTPYFISGFGRINSSGGLDLPAGNPRMYSIDLDLTCAERSKLVQTVIIQNNLSSKTCVMALSGAGLTQFSEQTADVTCMGGSNGAITVIPGGVAPFSYTWSVAAPNSANITGLPAGVYSYTASEACSSYTSGSIVINEPTSNIINVSTSQTDICLGNSATLTTSGAASYIWNNGAGTYSMAIVSPTTATTYSVVGTTSLGCTVYGDITINVLSLPSLSVTGLPSILCLNSPNATLTALPSGGALSGSGLNGNEFSPSSLLTGLYFISYTYTDVNGCTSSTMLSTNIVPAPSAAFFITPNVMCVTSRSIILTGVPSGGSFSGPGVAVGNVFTPATAGVGTHSITYTQVNTNGCSAVATKTVQVNACLGIDENMTQANAYVLYPNPNNGSFYIKATNDVEVNIINGLGQTIRTLKLNAENEHQILIEGLSSGVYFVQEINKRGGAQKIIVTK